MNDEEAVALIYNLKQDRSGGHERPHKPILLLAVIDLVEIGLIRDNRIIPSPELKAVFAEYFEIVRRGNDKNSPENPFYYLSSDGFWRLNPSRPKRAPGSWLATHREIAYASLLDDLYAILLDPVRRELLREAIYSRYFSENRTLLRRISGKLTKTEREVHVAESELPGRDSAFRKLVIEVYDHRCAACGLRLRLDNIVLVEAAHLIPWSLSRDDNPRNGMALCRNHHFAMDRHLIAPSPDGVWRVSPRLDDRRDREAELLNLNNQSILVPSQEKFRPRSEALDWRTERLLR
ncbi:MAG: HNH endonuclease [bacterium]